MDTRNLRERYEQILADEGEHVARAALASGAERRGAPRVAVVCADMSVNTQVPVSAINLSASGACFFAEHPFPAGSQIELSIGTAFTVQAAVVNCVMEETGSDLLEVHYRVHCRFAGEADGRSLLVLAKDREGEF